MKKQIFILFLAVLSLMISCSKATEGNSGEENVEVTNAQRIANTDPVQLPTNLISVEDAKKQLNNYKVAHPGVNSDQYALRTWISIDELEQYIAYVKEESSKKNIEVTGIDFIYTQKKEGRPGMANKGNEDYELTLMYAPTYMDPATNKNTTFDPMNSADGKPMKLSQLLNEPTTTDSLNSANGDTSKRDKGSGIGNNIFSCPNVCP